MNVSSYVNAAVTERSASLSTTNGWLLGDFPFSGVLALLFSDHLDSLFSEKFWPINATLCTFIQSRDLHIFTSAQDKLQQNAVVITRHGTAHPAKSGYKILSWKYEHETGIRLVDHILARMTPGAEGEYGNGSDTVDDSRWAVVKGAWNRGNSEKGNIHSTKEKSMRRETLELVWDCIHSHWNSPPLIKITTNRRWSWKH